MQCIYATDLTLPWGVYSIKWIIKQMQSWAFQFLRPNIWNWLNMLISRQTRQRSRRIDVDKPSHEQQEEHREPFKRPGTPNTRGTPSERSESAAGLPESLQDRHRPLSRQSFLSASSRDAKSLPQSPCRGSDDPENEEFVTPQGSKRSPTPEYSQKDQVPPARAPDFCGFQFTFRSPVNSANSGCTQRTQNGPITSGKSAKPSADSETSKEEAFLLKLGKLNLADDNADESLRRHDGDLEAECRETATDSPRKEGSSSECPGSDGDEDSVTSSSSRDDVAKHSNNEAEDTGKFPQDEVATPARTKTPESPEQHVSGLEEKHKDEATGNENDNDWTFKSDSRTPCTRSQRDSHSDDPGDYRPAEPSASEILIKQDLEKIACRALLSSSGEALARFTEFHILLSRLSTNALDRICNELWVSAFNEDALGLPDWNCVTGSCELSCVGAVIIQILERHYDKYCLLGPLRPMLVVRRGFLPLTNARDGLLSITDWQKAFRLSRRLLKMEPDLDLSRKLCTAILGRLRAPLAAETLVHFFNVADCKTLTELERLGGFRPRAQRASLSLSTVYDRSIREFFERLDK